MHQFIMSLELLHFRNKLKFPCTFIWLDRNEVYPVARHSTCNAWFISSILLTINLFIGNNDSQLFSFQSDTYQTKRPDQQTETVHHGWHWVVLWKDSKSSIVTRRKIMIYNGFWMNLQESGLDAKISIENQSKLDEFNWNHDNSLYKMPCHCLILGFLEITWAKVFKFWIFYEKQCSPIFGCVNWCMIVLFALGVLLDST